MGTVKKLLAALLLFVLSTCMTGCVPVAVRAGGGYMFEGMLTILLLLLLLLGRQYVHSRKQRK